MCLHRLESRAQNICVLQEVLMQHSSVHQSITDDVRYSEYTTSPSPSRLTTLLPAGWALSDGFSKGQCGIVRQWHRKETVGPCAHK